MAIPSWLIPVFALALLTGFIAFAFRQGMKVKPDGDKRDRWPEHTGGGWPPSHGGDGGGGGAP
jgi:hypothetical protein